MLDLAGLAMHGRGSVDQPGAEIHAQGLVAETYTEYRYPLMEMIDHSHSNAGL